MGLFRNSKLASGLQIAAGIATAISMQSNLSAQAVKTEIISAQKLCEDTGWFTSKGAIKNAKVTVAASTFTCEYSGGKYYVIDDSGLHWDSVEKASIARGVNSNGQGGYASAPGSAPKTGTAVVKLASQKYTAYEDAMVNGKKAILYHFDNGQWGYSDYNDVSNIKFLGPNDTAWINTPNGRQNLTFGGGAALPGGNFNLTQTQAPAGRNGVLGFQTSIPGGSQFGAVPNFNTQGGSQVFAPSGGQPAGGANITFAGGMNGAPSSIYNINGNNVQISFAGVDPNDSKNGIFMIGGRQVSIPFAALQNGAEIKDANGNVLFVLRGQPNANGGMQISVVNASGSGAPGAGFGGGSINFSGNAQLPAGWGFDARGNIVPVAGNNNGGGVAGYQAGVTQPGGGGAAVTGGGAGQSPGGFSYDARGNILPTLPGGGAFNFAGGVPATGGSAGGFNFAGGVPSNNGGVAGGIVNAGGAQSPAGGGSSVTAAGGGTSGFGSFNGYDILGMDRIGKDRVILHVALLKTGGFEDIELVSDGKGGFRSLKADELGGIWTLNGDQLQVVANGSGASGSAPADTTGGASPNTPAPALPVDRNNSDLKQIFVTVKDASGKVVDEFNGTANAFNVGRIRSIVDGSKADVAY